LGMRSRILITLTVVAGLAQGLWAAELVTLRNGFEMRCNHHGEAEGRVRLFLGVSEDNYIEVEPKDIAGVEQVDDLTPTAEAVAVPSATLPVQGRSAKLNQADLGEMLAKAGQEHNLDVDLLASIVKAESGGNTRAVSRAGARGLMQLMPKTASGLGVEDSFKPEQNVRGGSTYLDELLKRYDNKLALALAAYNAGPGAVDKYHGIPPYHETQAYVARVIHEFNRRVLAREAQARQAMASASTQQANAGR